MTTIHTPTDAIVIRRSSDADAGLLIDLAMLDDRAPLTGPALIAEVDGVARAALDLHDASVAADPFARTAELVELLRLHAGGTRANAGSLRNRVASFMRPVAVRAQPPRVHGVRRRADGGTGRAAPAAPPAPHDESIAGRRAAGTSSDPAHRLASVAAGMLLDGGRLTHPPQASAARYSSAPRSLRSAR